MELEAYFCTNPELAGIDGRAEEHLRQWPWIIPIMRLADAIVTPSAYLVPVFRRFGLGAVLGYLAAGVALGPYGLRFVANAEPVLAAAEIGVVMMLAGYAVFWGKAWGRVVAVVVASIGALTNLASLSAEAPRFALMVVLDILVIFAVVVHGGDRE